MWYSFFVFDETRLFLSGRLVFGGKRDTRNALSAGNCAFGDPPTACYQSGENKHTECNIFGAGTTLIVQDESNSEGDASIRGSLLQIERRSKL